MNVRSEISLAEVPLVLVFHHFDFEEPKVDFRESGTISVLTLEKLASGSQRGAFKMMVSLSLVQNCNY